MSDDKVYVYEHEEKDDLNLSEVDYGSPPDLKEMIRKTMLMDLKKLLIRKKVEVEKPAEPDTHDEWRKLNEE